jgi:sugar phosphate isomerase/epimerase
MLRLGGHGLPVDSDDARAFARAHAAFGYGAAYCPPVAIGDTRRLADIEAAFETLKITIAEVGIWRNLITPDEAVRKENLEFAAEKLAVADAVGALCAVSYIGSFKAGSDYEPVAENFGPDAFDAAVETVRHLIDQVKPRRAKLALEMMQYSVPDSVDNYRDLIAAVDRPQFAAHLDPVNLILTPRQYFASGDLIRECFDKLGPWLVSCHAKDIAMHRTRAIHGFDEIIPGRGQVDYRTYLVELDRLGGNVPLMLEHLSDADYAVARDHIFAVGDDVGVAFTGRSRAAS